MNEEDRNEVASGDVTETTDTPTMVADNESERVDDSPVDDPIQEANNNEMPQPMPLDEAGQPTVDNKDTNEQDMPMQESTEPVSAAAIGGRSDTSKLRLIWVVIAVIVLIAGAVAAWFLVLAPTDNANDTARSQQETAKLGVTPTVTDGVVEYSTITDSRWRPLSVDSDIQLAEGYLVRTDKDSQSVVRG